MAKKHLRNILCLPRVKTQDYFQIGSSVVHYGCLKDYKYLVFLARKNENILSPQF